MAIERTPAAVEVTPPGPILFVSSGESVKLTATVKDARGIAIPGEPVIWTSSNSAVVTLDTAGVVTAMVDGTSSVTATSGGITSAPVEITVARVAATVEVTPPGPITLGGEGETTQQLTASVKDALGVDMFDAPVTWASSNAEVATVSSSGLVTAVADGTANITAASGAATSTAVAVTVALPLLSSVQVSISAGVEHACGLTTDGTAYCWGSNDVGQLGNNDKFQEWLEPTPVVSSPADLKFVQIRTGLSYTCGITATGRIYCWGSHQSGQLGTGSPTDDGSTQPVPIASEQVFTALAVMGEHACGIGSDQSVWCWGYNFYGQVGANLFDIFVPEPTRIQGGHSFVALANGISSHTCGISTAGEVLCWGDGFRGKLGNGVTTENRSPMPVVAPVGETLPTFTSVAVGENHTCALSTAGEAFCWGDNTDRALGDGTDDGFRLTPTRVNTGLRFTSITAGEQFTCANTDSGDVYCWGRNANGQLGDGTTTNRAAPARVSSPLRFREISAGSSFVCAIAEGGEGNCWGSNAAGQLGTGNRNASNLPTPVRGDLHFGPLSGSH